MAFLLGMFCGLFAGILMVLGVKIRVQGSGPSFRISMVLGFKIRVQGFVQHFKGLGF